MTNRWIENLIEAEINMTQAEMQKLSKLVDEMHELTKQIKSSRPKERPIKSDTDRQRIAKRLKTDTDIFFTTTFGVVKIEVRKGRKGYYTSCINWRPKETETEQATGDYRTTETENFEQAILKYIYITNEFFGKIRDPEETEETAERYYVY